MKLKRILTALLTFAWAFAAQAGEALVTGKIRVGAYDVEVQNASRTNWVDGDLVITYLNTDTSVKKSFTLPRPTTARLLAVGGGGAGGQLKTYSSSYGLPGGGGAGGMVANDQSFSAAKYAVTVGAGGVAPRSATKMNGANGGESSVKGTEVSVTAGGGGGGGTCDVGQDGGSGGGGSYSGETMSGGSASGKGQGHAGGSGKNKNVGAGGGGAGGGGADCDTSALPSDGTTTKNVNTSGAGGAGAFCDITGENVEYARGGAGGVPRVYQYSLPSHSRVIF